MTEQEIMLTSILNCRRMDLYVDQEPLSAQQEMLFARMKKRRDQGEPLQYIIGRCEFMGLDLFVDERALIPRPETEMMVDSILAKIKKTTKFKPIQILELGTGTGNIAIALSKFLDNVHVTAVEVSPEALALAQSNAKQHDIDHHITFVCEDMVSYLQNKESGLEEFDIIVSNPPYIKSLQMRELPLDVQHEPRMALDGGKDGLHYQRAIIEQGHRFLKQGGFLILEIADGQRSDIEKLLCRQVQYQNARFLQDYTNTDRIVWVQRKSI